MNRDNSSRQAGVLPVFHVGMPKSASKTLQCQILLHHSQVDYLGWISTKHRRHMGCRDEVVAELVDRLLWEGKFDPDFDRCHTLHATSVKPALEAGRVPVFSWESMLEDTHEVQRLRARNIRKVFGQVRILAVIRHPIELVKSLYMQLLRRDNVGDLARRGQPIRFDEIDAWLTENWGQPGEPPSAHLEYADSIRMFADEFGADHVKVLVFEELVRDPKSFIRSVCEFIHVDPEEGERLLGTQGENRRMGTRQLEMLRRIDASPLRSLAFRWSGRRMRRRWIGLHGDGSVPDGPKAAPRIAPQVQSRIAAATREGNVWLRKQWNLPLEHHDYPL